MGFLIPFSLGVLIYGPPLTSLFVGILLVGFSYEWLKMGPIQKKIEQWIFYSILLGSEGIFLKWGFKESLAFLLSFSAFSYYVLRHYNLKKLTREKITQRNSKTHVIQV